MSWAKVGIAEQWILHDKAAGLESIHTLVEELWGRNLITEDILVKLCYHPGNAILTRLSMEVLLELAEGWKE